jgi:hypothetical protein
MAQAREGWYTASARKEAKVRVIVCLALGLTAVMAQSAHAQTGFEDIDNAGILPNICERGPSPARLNPPAAKGEFEKTVDFERRIEDYRARLAAEASERQSLRDDFARRRYRTSIVPVSLGGYDADREVFRSPAMSFRAKVRRLIIFDLGPGTGQGSQALRRGITLTSEKGNVLTFTPTSTYMPGDPGMFQIASFAADVVTARRWKTPDGPDRRWFNGANLPSSVFATLYLSFGSCAFWLQAAGEPLLRSPGPPPPGTQKIGYVMKVDRIELFHAYPEREGEFGRTRMITVPIDTWRP